MESLYTKYRPQTFSDVVGQGHVVATLERAVLEGRTGHAYLFCGPRGTGKTTMARLLAKALLCEQGAGHLPDGSCEQCRLVAAGEHPDVYELDAASNTGVDNVREEIISRVDYAPVLGSRKVYIIDEVHMLTTAAFNALLKTLEEPPSHVVFVLCTTDPQKILETILSRVQRFDFHAISNDDVLARIKYVCEQEGFVYEPQALDLIVRHAQGGMRDALTKLEQLATGGGGTITLEAAQELLGEVASSRLADVSMALARRDIASVFAAVAEFADAGRDLLQVSAELAARLRDVYVIAAVGKRPGIVAASDAELEQLAQEAAAFGSADRLSRALAILAEASSEMRLATNQRLVLELAFTRLARPEGDLSMDALAERVAVLERRLAQLESGAASALLSPVEQKGARRAEKTGTQPSPQPAASASVTTAKPEPRKQVAQGEAPAAASSSVSTNVPQRKAAQSAPAPAAIPAPSTSYVSSSSQVAQRPQTKQTASSRQAERAAAQTKPQKTTSEASTAAASQAVSDPGELQRRWKQVCDDLLAAAPPRGSLLMQSTIVSDDGSALLINLPKGSGFAVRMLDRADVRALIDPLVTSRFGQRRLVFAESSLMEADIARYDRQAAATRAAAPVAHGASQRPAPVAPSASPVPAVSSSHDATPVARSESSVVSSASASNPMPWDEPTLPTEPPSYDEVPYDAVPYDDIDVYGAYEEEEAPLDLPQQGYAAPQTSTRTSQTPHASAPAMRTAQGSVSPASASEAAPKPASQPQPEPQPKPQPKPKPEPQLQPQPKPTPQSKSEAPATNGQSEEEAALMALLTEVFGEGVTRKEPKPRKTSE